MNPSIRWLAGAVGGHRTAFLSTLAANLTSQLALWGIALSCAWLVGHGSLTAGVPAALVLLATAAAWWESYVAHDLAYLVLARLRGQAYEAIARIAPARLLGRRSGDLSAVVLSDIETLEWLFAHTLAQLITSFVVLTAGTVAAFLINPWLPLVTLPLACLVLTVPLWLRRFSSRHGSAMRAATADLHADVVDTVQGLREILAFGAVDRRRALLADKTRRLARAQTANAARGGLEAALTDVLLSTAAAASLAVVALTVSSPADAPLAMVLAAGSLAPAAQVALLLKEYGSLRASADRVHTLVTAPANVTPSREARAEPGDVVFEDVHFRYTPEGPEVLKGVSFTIPQGRTVALVGPSGAGKSTCVSLLLRYWDPDAGRITIGGVPLAQASSLVTVVPQDVHLFAGTVADNVRLGAPSADVEGPLATAQLPIDPRTVVGERGVALSGGQRARVAIARALATEAPVLVLDEAVANLDTSTEERLASALEVAAAGRTTLVIAHRPATIRRADHVVVLDDGRVVAQGTFAEVSHWLE